MASINFSDILRHSVRVYRRSEGSVDEFGHPAITYSQVGGDTACYLYAMEGAKKRREQGEETLGGFVLMAHATQDLRPGDVVQPVSGVSGLTRGEITWVDGIQGFDGATHHLEAEVKVL